jgi:hypothetical protein
MSDDRPPVPTYGPPITVPSGEFLGRIAYHAWCEADLSRPAVDWMELSAAERHTWCRVAPGGRRANPRRDPAQSRSQQLPAAAQVSAQRQDRYTLYICCRWDPHPADHGSDDEGHRWVPVEP